ncbi:MAG: glycosyltransferase family 2 protein, partial [Panacagrimonas sp.]
EGTPGTSIRSIAAQWRYSVRTDFKLMHYRPTPDIDGGRVQAVKCHEPTVSDVVPEEPPLVSIIVPCHDEAESLDEFHRELAAAIDGNALRFELIFVDDGSGDRTLEKLLELAARDPRVRVIELSRNFGKEAAMTAGLEFARGDAVIPIDADLQDPPSLIPTLIEAWQRGAEMVVAVRADRSTDSWLKRVTANLFYSLHNRLSSVRLPPNAGDFRLMSRPVVDAICRMPERHRFMKGLFAWVGFRTVSVAYQRQERRGGRTKFSGWRLWNFALEGITSFSTAPLRLWTYVGFLGALATAAYGVYLIVRTLVLGVAVPGYASLMTAVLFFGSLQLLALGTIGEYLGRVYIEVKDRPRYVVRKFHGAQTPTATSGKPAVDL